MGMRSGFPKMNPTLHILQNQNKTTTTTTTKKKKTLNKKLQKRKGDEIEQTA